MNDMKKSSNEENSTQDIRYELLKAIIEQHHEKILEYEVATDLATIHVVSEGQFAVYREHENYLHEGLIGKNYIIEEDQTSYIEAFMSCLQKASKAVVDVRCRMDDGSVEWNRVYLVSMADSDNQVVRIAGRFVSIQKDWAAVEKIRRKAEYDALTEVYNHKTFEEECEKRIGSCKKNALFLMLDVDDFKMINDSQGHAVGDRVLAQTGAILGSLVKGRGIAGRMGGDEFAAFVCGFDNKEQMVEFCEELRNQLKTITFDMEYSGSIGVSVKNGRKMSFQDLYFEADQAVYVAKNSGKNQVVFFDDIEEAVEEEPYVQVVSEHEYETSDDSAVLGVFGECVEYMSQDEYHNGIQKVLERVNTFFDADCMVIVRWQAEHYTGIEEWHKESAEITAKTLTEIAESGKVIMLRDLIEPDGGIYLNNVKDIKEVYPLLYEQLVGCRTWSVMGSELKDGMFSEGILFVVNPRKHLTERILLRILADYIVVRMLRQQLMEAREYDTTHDPLTRLWNRNSFSLWSKRWRDDEYESMGIVTTDIVSLSALNQALGYLAGNKRLVSAAKMLGEVFQGYRVFRYDQDEMLVFCPNIEKIEFMLAIKCLKERTEALDFALAIGFSWSNQVRIQKQIAEAEVVMDNDKLRLMSAAEIGQRMEQTVVDEVTQLIKEDMYRVYLQPKVNVHNGETVGAEALVRQMDSEIGLVGPAVFIPVLERYNCIHLVDLFVMEEMFRYQQDAIHQGRKVVPISVNFSKRTILQPDLLERMRQMKEKYTIPENLIIIEVTETIGDMDHVVIDHVAAGLKEMGFELSMDDFGTHYSNLAVLIQHDFESAKLDRSMIMDIETNKKSRIVLDYMTSLIKELGIQCVVEGIETKEQVDILKGTKCDVVQGFYFGKPVPKEEFYDMFIQ